MHIQIYSRSLKKTFKPLLNHLSDGYKKYLCALDKWLENVTRYFLRQLVFQISGESLLFSEGACPHLGKASFFLRELVPIWGKPCFS